MLKSDGLSTEGEHEIATRAINFFQNQFTEEGATNNLSLLQHIYTWVSDEDNIILNVIPREEEIKRVVFEFNGDSVCGPDGFTGHFY
uniref:Putative ovule protein n=1 Tax=Solanum chacoense TaxID=4108 RepID=A0A0V0HJC4_SOLCH